MRKRVLLTLLGFAAVLLFASAGDWSTPAGQDEPASFASLACSMPGAPARLGRLADGRGQTGGVRNLLVALPEVVGPSLPPPQGISGAQGLSRSLPGGLVAAGRGSRGPPRS